jgi:hypothetical protein
MKTADAPSPQISQFLKDFGPPYFDHVLAEYELVTAGEGLPPRVQEIIETRKSGGELTWGDLYLLEKYVIYRQPEEVLRARLPGLRSSYREIVGPGAYEQYLQSRQAAPLDGRIEELRADAGRLLDALHWAYAMAPEREIMRTGILRSIAMEMSIFVAIAALVVLLSAYLAQMLVSTVILVLLMGALGGFLSVQQRIENIPTEQDPILTMFQLQNGRFAVRLAPLTGAICALILFLVFQAGLLKGAAFPDMDRLSLSVGFFRIPSGAAGEFGKLLVWCFIAGFAERFVPDTLDNLVPKREEAPAAKPSAVVMVGQQAATAAAKPPGKLTAMPGPAAETKTPQSG